MDFSPASRLALEAARGLAKDLHAAIVLVHSTPPVPRKEPFAKGQVLSYVSPVEAAVDDAVRLSTKWAEDLRQDGTKVKTLNPIGPPAPTILEAAKRNGCSAIVLGTTGRSALKSLMVGSVAREVIRTSPLPVLAVPTRRHKVPKPAEKAAKPTKCILLATDFSLESDLALEAALRLAKDLKCVVRALHVVPLPTTPAPYPLGAEYSVEMLEGDEESSFEQLALLASRARRQKVGVVPSVQIGHPASVILAEAKTTGASLIVLGTHGQSAARRFFLGSVAQAVVQMADCPVLVVPGKARERGTWRR